MGKKYVDFGDVKRWMENNWPPNDLSISDNELDEMAIGVAGEIDQFVQKKLMDMVDEIVASSEETHISFEHLPEDTTGRIITDREWTRIKDKYLR